MATISKIEWTEQTWNPVTGCTKISPGCKYCYAEVMAKRLQAMGAPGYENGFAQITLMHERLDQPLQRKKPTIYFVNSMSDMFHENVPDDFIDLIFDTIRATPQHAYQILTKRAERMHSYFQTRIVPDNAWLGVSVEDKRYGIPDIMAWSHAHFTFFFVDPKGWKGIIGPNTMKELLERPKTEFLINLMYDFANRAASIEKHEADMIELLGEPLVFKGNETADERQEKLLGLYRKNTKQVYGGRSAYVSIHRPGTTKLLYFLVYLTRHPLGIKVFMEAAEKMEVAQRVTYAEVQLRKQFESAPILDLFFEHDTDQCVAEAEDNRHLASRFLLTKLSTEPLLIDYECWASFLKESNLYPTDLQLAMKELIDDGQVKNMNADVTRRRSQFIQPRYANESERWCLSTDKSKKRDT